METLEAVVAVGAADVLTVEVTGFAVLVAALEETAPLPPQLPKPDWQPVPQWSVCRLLVWIIFTIVDTRRLTVEPQ